ncbi:site-specific integrase [Phocaeicola vulgatus]|uniref:tyrosine-type recombinase/integrase n=1 Tax=Phocaeicola vulgatus TaxID=821 RepID=UPI001F47CD45|nr:site-specific integrase [Phocaeicola vulgatus]MCE9191219.1 site-specific integrase [Phocaeicola vulgatus]
MASVKIKFRPSTVKGRPGTIVYFITCHRIVRQITTEYKVFPCEWDEKQSRLVVTANNERTAIIQLVNQRLERDMDKLNRIIEACDRSKHYYSSDDVIREFQNSGKEVSFFTFLESVIMRLQQLGHIGTAKNYHAALGSFKRFRNNEDIPIETIDQITMEDYQAYLKSVGLTPNSISFYTRILRAVYNRAVEQELTKDRKPFRTVFTGTEKTLKRAILIGDIRRIKNLDLSLKPSLEFARDIFLFLFFCRGMSFIDAAFLKKTDIQNGILTYRRHKTGQVLHIKIIKPIKGLIDRYSSKELPYLLPIVTRPNRDERKQYETTLRRINNSLKLIADMVKLPIPLTTYVARHAWATIAKSKNVPINVISDALGHDSISTTQIYLAAIDTSVIDKANELIINDL